MPNATRSRRRLGKECIFCNFCFVDSELVNEPDAEYAATFMRLCKQKNVAVIWCSYHETPISNYGHGAVLDLSGSAADIANTLGAAILKEVSKVEASRGA